MAEQGWQLYVTDKALSAIADDGYDPQYGARPLKRVIQNQLANPLASELLRIGTGSENKSITVDHDGDSFFFKTDGSA